MLFAVAPRPAQPAGPAFICTELCRLHPLQADIPGVLGAAAEPAVEPGQQTQSVCLTVLESLQQVRIECCATDGCNGAPRQKSGQNSVFKPGWAGLVVLLLAVLLY